jgi:glycosyltransferase involved in cell wall biosynthesis
VAVKVIYLLHATGLCGGIKVVLEQIHRLKLRGWDVELWTPPAYQPAWFPHSIPWHHFPNLEEMGRTLRNTRAIKIATWWETAYWAAECLGLKDKGAYLVQDIETSYTNSTAEDKRCLDTYKLGLACFTQSRWVEAQLKNKFGVKAACVSLGVDHEAFRPLPMVRDRLRTFTTYRPSAGPRDLKGWLTAQHAILKVRKVETGASIVTFGLERGPQLPDGVPHIHMQGPSDFKLRELYSQAGAYALTSQHEGFGLPAAEAMACGCPVVATRADGNEEFCIDGETALVSQKGDGDAVAANILRLIKEPKLADELGERGRRFIQRYNWDSSIDKLETFLKQL